MAFIFKKWIGTRVEESIKHEYAKKLEEHKATLQEQVNTSMNRMQIEHQEQLDEKLADRNLYAKIFETLPSSASIELIDKQNMAGWSFGWESVEQLELFRQEWKKPEYFFLDKDIDILRD